MRFYVEQKAWWEKELEYLNNELKFINNDLKFYRETRGVSSTIVKDKLRLRNKIYRERKMCKEEIESFTKMILALKEKGGN